ncbi:phosphatidylinositol-4-phosphate 5-kinase family protein [Striga asiatica]|uniref:Phosphatidylinositol-4-phosphate 5-kinase family protein n=1 Tax=Striga asiatica TaxID=4170 RepID=A0A5A7QXP6_STRAF|nr:phosphatidylinositol-4-phosphate 5-kinase family protein [Striga asiatica]
MDGQKSQAKLTRTNSSLLRSSPTVRSSIQSLSSVSEIELGDLDEQKPHGRPAPLHPVRSGSSRLAPVLAVFLLSAYTIFSLYYREDVPTSENLLLALIFVAVFLFYLTRNRASMSRNFDSLKQMCDACAGKLGFPCFLSRAPSKPVQWFIGDSDLEEVGQPRRLTKNRSISRITREGVEFYSNGDFYEGEFHKGRCNGSGVYNYFVNGRYEGDWVDGKYDGYGIESWARGSKYRGQYRQGLRHGYGVYKFYTGDSFAGEWRNGQSHGVGVQTCADGSCYIGEFKCGVKHGLGCYHFRNGDRYAGEYFGDKIHGFGVYHFANGHFYEGSWHEGRKQGYGMYTFRNGETRCGEWDNGSLKTRIPPLTDAVLRAVQVRKPSLY